MSEDTDAGTDDGPEEANWHPAESPNLATLWGRSLVDELARLAVPVVYAPGSRSTPLTAAAVTHPGVETYQHVDERSAAFFALGIGRRTGRPAAVVTTSGTATANLHPAVVEADRGRVPLVVATADRPADLRDSGANQTVDQEKLYGDAVRWFRDLPEPAARERSLRRLRTDTARAVGTAVGDAGAAGPVHLNLPFHKPLDPVPPGASPEGDDRDRVPAALAASTAATGRADGEPFVRWWSGERDPVEAAAASVADAVAATDRGLIVAGPADGTPATDALVDLSRATGFPLLADPLSNLRYGAAVTRAPVCGGYDTYAGAAADWPAPDLVLGVGASPTSKPLRRYLAGVDARRVQVDPAGGWREATFASTDQVVASPDALARAVLDRLETDREASAGDARTDWTDRWLTAEEAHRRAVAAAREGTITVTVRPDADADTDPDGEPSEDGVRVTPPGHAVEGVALATAVDAVPPETTVFVSNSTPVRDLDRFVPPTERPLTVLGNRGASGIDGITSTAAGATAAGDGPGLLVTGDLAWLHDTNGGLALRDFAVDLTAVVLNNDGGGIFRALPIEGVDPPFTEAFRTPHGLTFEAAAESFDLSYRRVAPADLAAACATAVGDGGPTVLEVTLDSAVSHRVREAVVERVCERLS
jgi:2-succinyl-5-enolpyruvyl-6-hydroxy-3-cyclohexene-1-carboxylate synthase